MISPLISNIYFNEADKMLQRAGEVTKYKNWAVVEYARFADDLVVLIDSHPRQRWLRGAVAKRLREEFAKLEVEENEEKTRTIDLTKGESFGFLGFQIRRIRSRKGKWMPLCIPQTKKRTELIRKLKDEFGHFGSQPVSLVIERINPILRGWVNYFSLGHSSKCFSYIRNWVEKKIRRHLMKARKRKGFGWKRWSRQWLYQNLGLYNDYRVKWQLSKASQA